MGLKLCVIDAERENKNDNNNNRYRVNSKYLYDIE